jgi:Domain of unknown function (DUF4136)
MQRKTQFMRQTALLPHRKALCPHRKALFMFLLVLTIMGACRKTPDFDQLSSNFVVSTSFDTAVKFTNYRTYFISDSIAYIDNSLNNADTILYNDASKQLVAAVNQNMAALGYTFVPKGSNPDLGLNMGVIKNVNATTVYPGWWDGYPGWWYPGYWGWYYPYYYPWSYTYYVTTGSIIIDMADLKDAGADEKLTVIWNATTGGALGSDPTTNLQLGINAINQAFKQSQQLQTN